MLNEHVRKDAPWALATPRPRAVGGLRLQERRALLLLADLGSLALALYAHYAWLFPEAMEQAAKRPLVPGVAPQVVWHVVLAALWVIAAVVTDAYSSATLSGRGRSYWMGAGLGLAVGTAYLLLPFIYPLPPRRSDVLALPFLLSAAVTLGRIPWITVFAGSLSQRTALVIGGGSSVAALETVLRESHGGKNRPAYRLLGVVGPADIEAGSLPRLGDLDALPGILNKHRPDEVVVAMKPTADVVGALLDCRQAGLPCVSLGQCYEHWLGRVPVEGGVADLDGVLQRDPSPFDRPYFAAARLLDIGVAIVGCGVVALFVPFIWLANRLSSPGDVFYLQTRTGRGGKPFRICKFRSMAMDAERNTGAVWASKSDPRSTPLGRFLRKSRIDELPQFWNVLKGDMSLVGPRPERPELIEEIEKVIPLYRARHAVRPGITGWAQICYPYGSSMQDTRIKLEHDLYYIRHRGLMLDLTTLLRTIKVVFSLAGR